MKILVTGADGFVGRYVRENETCFPLELSGVPVDLKEEDLVKKAVECINPEAVIHLAAQSFIPESFENPKNTFDVNLFGTLNLLNALKKINFTGKFLYVGSGDMYGSVPENLLPIKENLPPRPRSPYAVSKVAAEALCYQWSQTEEFDIYAVRPFNHIGPGQSEQFAISDFAKQIVEIKLKRKDPVLYVGDIDVSRDFTDVRDIVNAYFSVLNAGRNGEIYNVCSGKERTIRSLLEMMLDLSGVQAEIKHDLKRLRPSEQRRVRGDYSKLFEDTGWEPQISIKKTLIDVLNYWDVTLK